MGGSVKHKALGSKKKWWDLGTKFWVETRGRQGGGGRCHGTGTRNGGGGGVGKGTNRWMAAGQLTVKTSKERERKCVRDAIHWDVNGGLIEARKEVKRTDEKGGESWRGKSKGATLVGECPGCKGKKTVGQRLPLGKSERRIWAWFVGSDVGSTASGMLRGSQGRIWNGCEARGKKK